MKKFSYAIVRKPCKALVDGISTAQFVDPGEKPIYENAVQQHAEYVKTLEALGAKVLVLEADEDLLRLIMKKVNVVLMVYFKRLY